MVRRGSTTIPAKILESIRQELATMQPPQPEQLSQREAFNAIRGEIQSALDRGFTLEAVLTYLKGHGFDLGLSTARAYMAADATKSRAGSKHKAKEAAALTDAAAEPKPTARPKARPVADAPTPAGAARRSRFVNVRDDNL